MIIFVIRVGRMVKLQKLTIFAKIVPSVFVTYVSNCITKFFRGTPSLTGKTLTNGQRTLPWWDRLSGATTIRVKFSSCIAGTTVGCVALFASASTTSKAEYFELRLLFNMRDQKSQNKTQKGILTKLVF